MRFRLGPPPDSLSDAELASGEWQPVPLPPLWAVQVLSLPVGGLMAFLVFGGWVILTPRFDITLDAPTVQVVAAFVGVVLAGMLVQVGAHPGRGVSDHSVLGLWPSRLVPYTACLTRITKRVLIATLLLPFLVLALLPLLVAAVLHIGSGWLVFGSCLAAAIFGLNAVLSLAAWRLPATCVIAGRGFRSYWRPAGVAPTHRR